VKVYQISYRRIKPFHITQEIIVRKLDSAENVLLRKVKTSDIITDMFTNLLNKKELFSSAQLFMFYINQNKITIKCEMHKRLSCCMQIYKLVMNDLSWYYILNESFL